MDLTNLNDKPEEACGVFGIYAPQTDVARLTYFALHALQHRGQESAGIAVSDGESVICFKDMGLVPQVFDERKLASLKGYMAIGHVRYSTTGSSKWENAQPIQKSFRGGSISVVHNGNLINSLVLKEELLTNGIALRSTSDTEVIAALLVKKAKKSVVDALKSCLPRLIGAYSLLVLTEKQLFAARDPYGIRPLALGKLGKNWVVASESCAFDILGAEFVRELEPGELLIIDENGCTSIQLQPVAKRSLCIFEFIYFARPDSYIYGRNLYLARKNMGRELAKEAGVKADLVIGLPDSGTPAAIGFAEESGIPFGEGLIKNRYVGRTFIQPEQSMRQLGVKMKLNPLKSVIKGKTVVLVDDSIVRGNTSRQIVSLLKESGAKEVHMRVSSPPIIYPCFYGIDTDTQAQLIAAQKTVAQIQQFIGADSLVYLSYEGLVKATGCPKEQFCLACLDGVYPIAVGDKMLVGKLALEKTKV